MVKPFHPRDPRSKSADPTTTNKPVKFKKTVAVERTHYDMYSKSRGYLCTCHNEDAAHNALQSMYYENEKFWRRARSEGKKSKQFDCYALARTGIHERLIELQFAPDEEDVTETYEDIAANAGGVA